MQIEIAELGKMSQSGNSLLKLIQNNDLPTLDLFVREAVQNSLDASIEVKEHNSVYVNIGVKNIDTKGFSKHLEGITDYLCNTFANSNQQALFIEDSNTTGLTGSLDFEKSTNSNVFKLIYGISMGQDAKGSGGSWGLGKTVYFRVGIGLVVYYSRIKKIGEEGYEHRLAVTMVEDEKLPNNIIPKPQKGISSGVAWWGEKISSESKSTVPITDETTIFEILESLSIKPYEGVSTGTKVIIPFIDKEKLLQKNSTDLSEVPYWENDIEEYLRIAIQRWYAPRLDNNKYIHGKFLNGHINDEKINKEEFLTFFTEIQGLYNAASQTFDSKRYHVKGIQLRDTFEAGKNNAGYIAFKKFTKKELGMLPPNNEFEPYTAININNPYREGNTAIISYVRKPGMIVTYEVDGDWCRNIGLTNTEEYLIAVYVPASNSLLVDPDYEVTDLESYLRKSEMADHTSWSDISVNHKHRNIVDKIRVHVNRKIKDSIENKNDIKEKQGINKLSREVGKMLLPPTGFGRRASSRVPNSDNHDNRGPGKSSGAKFVIRSQKFISENSIEILFDLALSKNIYAFSLELFIASESGKIPATEWEGEEEIGTPFPARIKSLTLERSEEYVSRYESVKSIKNVVYAERIEKKSVAIECTGTLVIECEDPHLQLEVLMNTERGKY